METMTAYRRAQDGFDQVMAAVGDEQWDRPSTCAEWTIRDVAGHVIWGQRQLRAWAVGEEYESPTGFPGSSKPGELAADDPLATWRTARAAADEALTDETLARVVTIGGPVGDIPVIGVAELLTTDLLGHSWDIGHAAGQDVRLDAELLPGSMEWSRKYVSRSAALFGPEVTPEADADDQDRLLAYLGRRPGQHLAS
ncbi:TIGR03086 family metal-binding protein [Stackebrandtia nassauensis]|uniref:Mycothiol-dependent maleylpyruvate isomerase metal-binding domain-containing protein n=1 Tax=Stackebrandtia nassauensis (strain DSM 44728 / CIP 108903 / NRRL B-16338 / NBRC 102104 / LLR-40K-21) TaxID=446470 RepID=D3Q1S1_STANL|nr:TIGR03086 family metal-binding protein [Stackebrandtia nassauensis]ADD39919.1 hypothetical protein Snas_0200 [Stackebrandtia nassauensis DSM 44728]